MEKVSIIIPVYNDAKVIDKTLHSIYQNQKSDIDLEVIIVDNGSNDNISEKLQKYDIKLISESENLNSPYSARNRGIEISKGDIIVLLDATCRPNKNWLQNGLKCLFNEAKTDIVAPEVKFDFQGKITFAKIFDSLFNIRMKESVNNRKVAKTARLFIKKSVYDKIGLFPEKVRSGADVRWTKKATNAGFGNCSTYTMKIKQFVIHKKRLISPIKERRKDLDCRFLTQNNLDFK